MNAEAGGGETLAPWMRRRRAGVLLHPTSLPGPEGNGVLGPDAYRFVDWLAQGGASVWQTLPHGPTHADRSPYQCLSVYAGNPFWISIGQLAAWGWLGEEAMEDPQRGSAAWRERWLQRAWSAFAAGAAAEDRAALDAFREEQRDWLDDYALYQALREENEHRAWTEWPVALRDRQPAALAQARERLRGEVERIVFQQFVFFRQWEGLKRYANERGILLFGDMPIYVALDSADVWAHRDQFDLDRQGRPRTVAGVPPDYFSETGQLWGNPHYNWEHMAADGFRWWHSRLRAGLRLFDILRIDHFRGFEAYWSIPAGARTAQAGRWVEAPGRALFQSLRQALGGLALVAEDLGVITPGVTALRREFGLPGMKILQFAFDSDAANPYLPHNHEPDSVVYTGTHDNNTTVGWFQERSAERQARVLDYLGRPAEPMPWPLIRAALASVARLAVIPMQDLLALDASHRMNAPSTTEGNWRWRFDWDRVPAELPGRLGGLVELYGRGSGKWQVTSSK